MYINKRLTSFRIIISYKIIDNNYKFMKHIDSFRSIHRWASEKHITDIHMKTEKLYDTRKFRYIIRKKSPFELVFRVFR